MGYTPNYFNYFTNLERVTVSSTVSEFIKTERFVAGDTHRFLLRAALPDEAFELNETLVSATLMIKINAPDSNVAPLVNKTVPIVTDASNLVDFCFRLADLSYKISIMVDPTVTATLVPGQRYFYAVLLTTSGGKLYTQESGWLEVWPGTVASGTNAIIPFSEIEEVQANVTTDITILPTALIQRYLARYIGQRRQARIYKASADCLDELLKDEHWETMRVGNTSFSGNLNHSRRDYYRKMGNLASLKVF